MLNEPPILIASVVADRIVQLCLTDLRCQDYSMQVIAVEKQAS
jgi:hypothetical protein